MNVADLMKLSQVSFGTSGVRGLVTDLSDQVVYCYTCGFLKYLEAQQELKHPGSVAVAGDYRVSTDRIMRVIGQAITDQKHTVINLGQIPTPAGAYYGVLTGVPFIMVTGSHIPADRNGIKYYHAHGEELLKADEARMLTQSVDLPSRLFDDKGSLCSPVDDPLSPVTDATTAYVNRYLDFFGPQSLKGMRVGLYEHSTVGRDVLYKIFTQLGVEVVCLGRSELFIPVDTEVLPEETRQQIEGWMQEHDLEVVISADGDCDRPLFVVRNAEGHAASIHGDRLDIMAAKELNADTVVVTASCNTGVELCGFFSHVIRTKIGSPYVIAKMNEIARTKPDACLAGYEANGGFLLRTDVTRRGHTLRALATRDAVLPLILVLAAAHRHSGPVHGLFEKLPQRYTASALIDLPSEKSQQRLTLYHSGMGGEDIRRASQDFSSLGLGPVSHIDWTDGLRMIFGDGSIVHVRPSGNAPQLRAYAEARTQEMAQELSQKALGVFLFF